jgi:hypothetical protein
MDKDMISITICEYNSLLEDSKWLNCLQQAGVDNWDGYEDAIDLRDAEDKL